MHAPMLALAPVLLSAAVAGYSVTDLDDDGLPWGFYEDGNRAPVYSASYADGGSDLTFWADDDTLPYSMIHFYKNSYLPPAERQSCEVAPADRPARNFCFSTKWLYGVVDDPAADPSDPETGYNSPTPFNNECLPGLGCWTSKIQAVEFSASRWECGRRNEVALQWCNVCARDGDWHSGVPVWRYWDGGWRALPESCGITEAMSRLAHDELHELEVCGAIDGTKTTYTSLSIDGTAVDLSSCVTDPVNAVPSHGGKLLAAAIQHDGTSRNHAFRVHVQDMHLEYD
ncbi:hypothetical protein ACHAXT_013283 [Thalassiosira profunda]